ncbi:extracellular serine-rich protein [Pochonia chlamydosporia 170]|uniref:Extracellular serine-rich protein n=1 Tax=Pochonia chlamydosporia 170 TaxID=1380566 RepID=A0A179EWB5_METCM|nr:extracellular serine-rich protein [Pochonia chlamydosporia 170]OAQ57452.1 extracellular serine-rich protein [Pochonia chlamydosporia 170]
MRFISAIVAPLCFCAVQSSGKTIRIAVGKDGLVFSPNSVTADRGDILEYQFYKQQHSVAMGDFANGCTPAAQGGFFSGVMKTSRDGPKKKVFQVIVNSTEPMAFYCTVGSHCQNGMVGVINPSSTDSLDKYKSTAKDAKENKAPLAIFGGKIVKSSRNSTTTSSGGSPSRTGGAGHAQAAPGSISVAALGFAVFLM